MGINSLSKTWLAYAQENGVVVQVHERYYTVEYFDNDMQEMHQAKVPKASIKPSNVVNVDTKPPEGNTSAEEKQDRVSDEVKESDADEGQEHIGKEEGGDAETVELVQKIFDAINPNHNGKLAKTEFKKAIFLQTLTWACYLVLMKRCPY